ncbi:DEAD/DEAH box helicase [Chromatocurvus halotolerans]|uniref:ATP-dependent RNA helicase DeaD n=1 Tax=Chromatocurvus halotolerans TaxID=1132028 RepID=A0A4R2L1C9_9GAMM|nr:DEAD/DEAH box helicase [Chromatocurvus halotolerans]TCO77649.1 ATP-dependent RNA helicase DeaD [Chromatocurvus halotolerans]
MSSETPITRFADLDLPAALQQALVDVGYESPSAIQAMTIPPMLEGVDLVGQAQTGTGKTAAFALPCLARLDPTQRLPQVLVLAPTRELALQVAEAFQNYARHLPSFHVLPLYGGADMRTQLRQLQRGVQVIVGTPGRVMDHMRRGSLDLGSLRTLVLDEADEMLRMGFIDDVEWILSHTPPERQIALFSATMPEAIRRIAKNHLRNPHEITAKVTAVAKSRIRQRVWMMAGVHKLDALTRILEVEDFDGIIIFVRTRIATTELAEKLAARGYATAALNGDVAQNLREKTVENLKSGRLDILVATDVAARGLDVDRISHVINYDIPYDAEAYTHRIGRTGRAGRHGETILFVANRERRLLRAIERATGDRIEPMQLPTPEEVTDKRATRFKQRITEALDVAELDSSRRLVESYQHEFGVPVLDIAAALAFLAQGSGPAPSAAPASVTPHRTPVDDGPSARHTAPRQRTAGSKRADTGAPAKPRPQRDSAVQAGMRRYRIEVGHLHDVKPGNIVGAIANEADMESEYIGKITINDEYSTVELPEGMPSEVFQHLRNVWVSGRKLQISEIDATADGQAPPRRRKAGDTDAKASRPRLSPNGPRTAAAKSGARPDGKRSATKKPRKKPN